MPRFGCYAASEVEGRRAGPPGLGSAATIRRRVCRIRARLFARRPAIPAASMDWRRLSGDVVVQLFWQGMYDELQKREHRIVLGQHRLCDSIGLVDRGQPEGSNPWTSEKPTCVGHPCGGSQVLGAQESGSPFFIGVTSDGLTQQQESAAGHVSSRGDVEGDGCAQQNRNIAGAYSESIRGETFVFPELVEGGDSGGSGCTESIPENLSTEEQEEEQEWMTGIGVRMFDPAESLSYEECV